MFTPSDIVVLILLVGSGILIWIARRPGLSHPKDTPAPQDHDSPSSVEQLEVKGESDHHTGPDQSQQEDDPWHSK